MWAFALNRAVSIIMRSDMQRKGLTSAVHDKPPQSLFTFAVVQLQYLMSTKVTIYHNSFPDTESSQKSAVLHCLIGHVKLINGRKQMQKL